MAKLTLTDLTNLNASAITALNANFAAIEEAIENTLSLDGTSPNGMSADFDLDGNDILNGGNASFDTLTLNGTTVTSSGDLLEIPDDMVFQTLGVGGATPDSTNKLAVSSDAILFNKGSSDDVQVKLNKTAAGDSASIVFQTNFSGRAEIGNLGDNNFAFKTSTDGSTFNTRLLLNATSGAVTSPSDTGGIGYSTGAGGAVTQATSKTTGVTLNKVCGDITMHNAALASGASVNFTLTNSAIGATDLVVVNVVSGGTANAYTASVTASASGSCSIRVTNTTGGSLGESPVIRFAVLKGVTS